MGDYSLCRISAGVIGLEFDSVETIGSTIKQVIENDKNFGKMVPANGKYFTYTVLNEDQEFTQKQAVKGFAYAKQRWRIYADLPSFRRVPKNYDGVIDFRVEFRTVDTDPDKQLKANTIMYHYYPIQDTNNPLRGLCVVNKAFFFTSHGNEVLGTEFKKHGIEVQFLDGKYSTMDFDKLLAHELGHGLGLPHDTEPENMMAYREDLMVEYPSERDIARMQAKYGVRKMSWFRRWRWLRWLQYASER